MRSVRLWVTLVVALVASTVAAVAPGATPPARAQRGRAVAINEIHFHPECELDYKPCPDAPLEFVELHNPTAAAIDISGWWFSDGLDFLAPASTTIAAGGYFVIAEDPAAYQVAYGRAADGEFGGSLSNSGERLALSDGSGAVVDEVTYDDGTGEPGAWPVDADGRGHSLQLISAADDDGSSLWWDTAAPTPGAVNATVGSTPPVAVTDFTWTVLPAATEAIEIAAIVRGASNVALDYRVGYPGTTVTIPMTSGGANRFSATIPASAFGAGDLVRFRLRVGSSPVAPRSGDTIGWVGTTVADPGAASTLPVLQWFTSDANYQAGYDSDSDAMFEGVLAFEGVVYDAIRFRARGTIARGNSFTKRNWKFSSPDGHSMRIDGIDYAVDTFALQGGFADDSRVREHLGHTIAGEMGLVSSQTQHVRVELNGEFFGLHTLQEHPDGRFLDDNELPNATLYKSVRGDYEAGPTHDPDVTIGWEEWDIPGYINMLAAASVIQNNDFGHQNFYWWYDRDDHERFEGMIWDLDLSQGVWFWPSLGLATTLDSTDHAGRVWSRWRRDAPIFYQVLSEPHRELYLRRVRTLADEWFASGRYEQMARDAFANVAAEWALDYAKWGNWHDAEFTSAQAIERLADTWIDRFSAHIFAGGPDGDIPGAQPADPDLALVVDHSPTDPRAERIEIVNREAVAIDVSGWLIGGTSTAALPPGSVLPANGSAYVVGDDRRDGYRAVTTDHYVLGEYSGELAAAGGRVELASPDGVVHAQAEWGDPADTPIVLNEWNAVSSSRSLLEGDARLGTVIGNGGDWFELVVVQDHLDLRGWVLEIAEAGAAEDTLVFSDDPVWADVRAGTIITVAERDIVAADGTVYREDAGYRPEGGDWWIHVVAGDGGTGRYVTATNFVVSADSWQLTVSDPAGAVRFGPAGEGIGTLAAGGVSRSEIGELEADPGPATTASAPYGDGDSSTFGLANGFDERIQDLASLRPALAVAGDVDCSGTLTLDDAQHLAQHLAGGRSDGGGCPLPQPASQINSAAGDLDGNSTVDAADIELALRCLIDPTNPTC